MRGCAQLRRVQMREVSPTTEKPLDIDGLRRQLNVSPTDRSAHDLRRAQAVLAADHDRRARAIVAARARRRRRRCGPPYALLQDLHPVGSEGNRRQKDERPAFAGLSR
jgi:hypothetical protein